VATVQLTSAEYMDYVHMGKFEDGWKIVYVLWEPVQKTTDASDEDRTKIKQTALDYFEGYYTRSTERLEKAFHDKMDKKALIANRRTGKTNLAFPLTKSRFVEMASKSPADKRSKEVWNVQVKILDVYQNCASVKISSVEYVDFVHMGKFDGEWKIMNVLWEPNTK